MRKKGAAKQKALNERNFKQNNNNKTIDRRNWRLYPTPPLSPSNGVPGETVSVRDQLQQQQKLSEKIVCVRDSHAEWMRW